MMSEERKTIEQEDLLLLSPEEVRRIIEAVLFASGAPVLYDRLAEVLHMSPSEVKNLIRAYAEEYNSETLPRGVRLLVFDDSCQLCTKEKYEPYIRKALGISKEGGNLSNSSLETLAVIAYNQPVTKAFVEQVRGVDSSYAISVLLDRNLIEKAGRLDVPGKPNLYATTPDFLRVFGLESVEQLPEIDLTEISGGSVQKAATQLTLESLVEDEAKDQ